MKKSTIFSIIVIGVIIVGVAFYGGMKYQEKRSLSSRANIPKFLPQQQQQQFQQSRIGAGLINGEIISKDDKSITVKLRDGGSKIVFFSNSTKITKFVDGGINDLDVGKLATVEGSYNSDGSILAKSIQLRPVLDVRP